MSDLYSRLRAALPNATFHPAATTDQIVRVERALGTPFPQWLRELYLCCNGISGSKFQEPYLNLLESPLSEEGSDYSLLGLNRFHRNECDLNRHYYEDGRLDEWEKAHARNFLIIGSTGATAQEWAIRLDGSTEILWYDVRNPGDYTVLGQDLVEVITNYESEGRRIHAQIYRGRAPLRRDENPSPPTDDVELLIDILMELHRGTLDSSMEIRQSTRPNWNLYQAISKRPGEAGSLWILTMGRATELQIASRDGHLPFIFRLKAPFLDEPLVRYVEQMPEAFLFILFVFNLQGLPDDQIKPSQIRSLKDLIWRAEYYQSHSDPDLESLAQTLFTRDDRRLQEENPLGE